MHADRQILASRLLENRSESFGVNGVAPLARHLDMSERAREHYESGVMIPATIFLEFIAITEAEP